jgi:hypothetical protein
MASATSTERDGTGMNYNQRRNTRRQRVLGAAKALPDAAGCEVCVRVARACFILGSGASLPAWGAVQDPRFLPGSSLNASGSGRARAPFSSFLKVG